MENKIFESDNYEENENVIDILKFKIRYFKYKNSESFENKENNENN